MGKDKSGGFHPGKGKPSGSDSIEEMEVDASAPLLHPNRNVSKGSNSLKAKENSDQSYHAINMAITQDVEAGTEELPEILSREKFMELANFRADCCATIYMPTHQAGVEVNEKHDAILLKNALQDLSRQLAEKGLETKVISKMLTPGYELVKDDKFWARMKNGLALFISEGYFKFLKMRIAPTFGVSCHNRFYMAPLLPLLARKEYFYLLVINKHKCKLFRADAFAMEQVPVEGLPDEVMAVKRLSDKDASTVRVGTASGGGGANFHGVAGGNPDEKTNTAVYFEAVDDVLYKEIFNKENVPLLLAGVEHLIPIYKAACDYHNVWPQALTGSHEHEEIHALYAKAREIMSPYFMQQQENAKTVYANQSATELTSSIAADVIPAAYYGRISHLFVEKEARISGSFNETTGELLFDEGEKDNSENLLDMAVIKTLGNNGEVFLMDREEMPVASPIAAVFRY